MKEKILIIKDIEEIEKYRIRNEEFEKLHKNYKLYDFRKIDKVIFKCCVPMGNYELTSKEQTNTLSAFVYNLNYRQKEIKSNEDCSFFCKNVVFEKGVAGLDYLSADNLIIKGGALIEILDVKEKLICDKMQVDALWSKKIKANTIHTFEYIAFKKIKAKILRVVDLEMINIKCDGGWFYPLEDWK